MKKARFIGVLMAVVMAAVPFTGTAKNMGFKSVEAKAYNSYLTYDDYHYGVRIDEPNQQGDVIISDFRAHFTSFGSDGWSDLTFNNGILTIKRYNRVLKYGTEAWKSYNTFYLNTGGDRLAFQLDGNLVAYDSKTGRPTAQTRTASMFQSTNQGYAYEYVLTPDGRLLIYRFYPGYSTYYGPIKGKYQIIWDSSKDKMYRI